MCLSLVSSDLNLCLVSYFHFVGVGKMWSDAVFCSFILGAFASINLLIHWFAYKLPLAPDLIGPKIPLLVWYTPPILTDVFMLN